MERAPITRQRSPWVEFGENVYAIPATRAYERKVSDGKLMAIVGEEPLGWHLSISFRNHKGDPTRYPTWDEIAHARDELLPADVAFVMHLPLADEYVALHDTTFHLHEHPERK